MHIVTWYSSRYDKELSAGIFHNELAKALQSRCETAIWFPYDSTVSTGMTCETEWGVLTFRSNIRVGRILAQVDRAKKDFEKIIKVFRPDIIHAHTAPEAGIPAVFIGKKYHIPVVITEHLPIEMLRPDLIRKKLKLAFVYRSSAVNICVSDDLREKLMRSFKREKFITLYNGVEDPVRLLPGPTHIYRIDGCINAVIVASFYDKEIKGFQYLLPALKKINDYRKTKVFLHICGGGRYLEYYKRIAKKIGVSDYCRYYGSCNKTVVFQIVDQADFGVSASVYESAGVAVEEMLLLGKPVVVTNSGGASSLVSKENSITVGKGSTAQLVKGISKMCSSFYKYDSDKIRRNALNTFEMNIIVNKQFQLYKRVLRNHLGRQSQTIYEREAT